MNCECQSSIIHASVDIWISTLISKQGYLCKDILQWMSVECEYPQMDINVFMDIRLQSSILLWITVFNYPWFYGYPYEYPCMDLQWILDPGPAREYMAVRPTLERRTVSSVRIRHMPKASPFITKMTINLLIYSMNDSSVRKSRDKPLTNNWLALLALNKKGERGKARASERVGHDGLSPVSQRKITTN